VRTRSAAIALAGSTGFLLLLGSPAFAHVTVHSTDAVSGGSDAELSFRVPDEESTAATTKVEIVLPTDQALAGAYAQPKAGWTLVTATLKLATPITTDDGKITDVLASATWTATNGGIKAGQYDEFNVAVGHLPTAKSLVFKALQTYSDGNVVRWIELKAPGATSDPAHPAPVLTLSSPSPGADSSASSAPAAASASAAATAAPAATSSPAASKASDNTAKAIGGAGLGVAVLAALLALAAFLRAGRNSGARGKP
jgi:uncharacterized protein YcnI